MFKSKACLVAAATAMTAPAYAGIIHQVQLDVAADTYIRAEGTGPDSKNDADPDNELIIGVNRGAENKLNGLLRFDLSPILALGALEDLQINSVTLTLTPRDGDPGDGDSLDLTVNSYALPFVEADATYNDPDGDGNPGTGDTTPGGTPGTLLSSLNVDPTPGVINPIVFGTTADFQNAVAAQLNGDGTINLLLRGTSAEERSFIKVFDETVEGRPVLTVDVEVVPEPGSMALFAIGGLLMARRRR